MDALFALGRDIAAGLHLILGSPLEPILVAFFGLVLGSYATLLSYRLPRGLPTALTRSRCPSCQRVLAGLDLIPIGSWLLRRGRCGCPRQEAVSLRYPLIELICGLLVLVCWWRFGLSLAFLLAAGFALCLLVQGVIRLESRPAQRAVASVLLGLGVFWFWLHSNDALALGLAATTLLWAGFRRPARAPQGTGFRLTAPSAAPLMAASLPLWGGFWLGGTLLALGLLIEIFAPRQPGSESQALNGWLWICLLTIQFVLILGHVTA